MRDAIAARLPAQKPPPVVLGVLKRGGKVSTKMIPNTRAETLLPIMKRMILPDSIVYTDTWASYNALAGFTDQVQHLR